MKKVSLYSMIKGPYPYFDSGSTNGASQCSLECLIESIVKLGFSADPLIYHSISHRIAPSLDFPEVLYNGLPVVSKFDRQ